MLLLRRGRWGCVQCVKVQAGACRRLLCLCCGARVIQAFQGCKGICGPPMLVVTQHAGPLSSIYHYTC